MEYLAGVCNQATLTLILVHIDANIFHGWSSVCGTDHVDPMWSFMLPRQGDQPLHLIYPHMLTELGEEIFSCMMVIFKDAMGHDRCCVRGKTIFSKFERGTASASTYPCRSHRDFLEA